VALRALGRRVAKLEVAGRLRPTPFAVWFGSVDAFVDRVIMRGTKAGQLCAVEMADVVAALRSWESDGHYSAWEHERKWQLCQSGLQPSEHPMWVG
jgi:hypothetical protein